MFKVHIYIYIYVYIYVYIYAHRLRNELQQKSYYKQMNKDHIDTLIRNLRDF